MKMIKVAGAVLLFCSLIVNNAMAQQKKIEDPAHWSYEAKKLSGDEYELTYKLRLDEGWHIWSLTPGGDGYEIVPSFTIDKTVGTVKGKVTESGHSETVRMEGVDNAVTYLSGEIAYKQVVQVKGGKKVMGEHEYQVCNDMMCLPPKTVKFEVTLNRD